MRMTLCSLTVVLLVSLAADGQDAPKLDKATQEKLKQCDKALAAAQKAEDEGEVRRQAKIGLELLGDQAGIPEVPDYFQPTPKDANRLKPDELATAFNPYITFLARAKWWKIGLDPTKTNHSPREVATVIEACLAASKVSADNSEKLVNMAREAGDYLIWTQEQAKTGVIPFPAVRNGKGRPFEVAEEFYKQAEKAGRYDEVVKNGWAVEDDDNGGLQFDNGVSGVALIRLFEATKEERYKKAAIKAADWAAKRPVISNWNYNSFSVYLLAVTYRITGEKAYLDTAKKKARLGIMPGQLTDGPRKGRWADAHNARPAYHYFLARGLAALAAVMPKDDADLPVIVESLRLALNARNPDYQRGVVNPDAVLETLILVKSLPKHVAEKLNDCGTDEALENLERYATDRFQTRKSPIGPAAWGQLLAYVKDRK